MGVALKGLFQCKRARNDHSEYQQGQLVCTKHSFCSLIHGGGGRNEKIFMPKYKYCDERGKFKSGVRIALWEKIYSYGKQTNKKQIKAQQIRSRIFRKLRVTSAFPFETKKGKCLSHAHRALQSWMTVPYMSLKSYVDLCIHCWLEVKIRQRENVVRESNSW